MASSSGGAKRPAASKGTGNKNTKNSRPKSGAAPKSAGGRGKNAPRPIRREVGAVVCAFLGIFSAIGYFNVDALFIDIFCGFLKGLLGWGYYLIPPALLAAARHAGPSTAGGRWPCA